MTPRISVAVLCLSLALFAVPANSQSFEVASVKPSTTPGIACVGGPGSTHLGAWQCSDMPLGLVIAKAFGFSAFQFSPHNPCCTARFNFDVRYPPDTTHAQFNSMLQNLLRERFQLAFHYQTKELPIYQLAVAPAGIKMKESVAVSDGSSNDPWWSSAQTTIDKDGYPVFPPGHGGLAGGGHYRWTAFNVSTADIARTLQDQSGRPVVDSTKLTGKYDVDLKWVTDMTLQLTDGQRAELEDQVGRPLDAPSGPTLHRAIQEQLGLRLIPGKGTGEIVVIDHLERVPTGN